MGQVWKYPCSCFLVLTWIYTVYTLWLFFNHMLFFFRTVGKNSPTLVISRGTCVFTLERSLSAVGTAKRLSQTLQPVKLMRKLTGHLCCFKLAPLLFFFFFFFYIRFSEPWQVHILKLNIWFPSSPLKPYICSTCGKSYRQISLLNLHRKRHTGEARYTCRLCGKTFTTSGNLKRHQLVHSGEKPYQCDYCHKAFSDPTAKMRHLETHDTDKGNKCPHCDKRFSQVPPNCCFGMKFGFCCCNVRCVMSCLDRKSESSLENPHHGRTSQMQGMRQTVYLIR